MTRAIWAALVTGAFVATAGPAAAERFEGVKYLGGEKGFGPRTGTLVVEAGQLRFEDRKGREVFVRPLESARSWVGSEKRTSLGRVLGNVALLPVLIPLSGGFGTPWLGGTEKDSPIVVVRIGSDDARPLRLRAPFARLPQIVDAINVAARATAAPPPSN